MRKIFCFLIGIVIGFPAFAKDTECNPISFRVTYSCGDGKLAKDKVLPESRVATYGEDFKSLAFSREVCTPPSGYVFGGLGIFVDGAEVAVYSNTGGFLFQYNYTSDITIMPHYIQLADSINLAANLGTDAIWYGNDPVTDTWRVIFPYGMVRGVGHCSSVKPNWINYETAGTVGYVAVNQQNLITDDTGGGVYCYCKMTEPYYSKSKWVFRTVRDSPEACEAECPGSCAWRISNAPVFRSSVFAGAIN